jgi:hypothetical protein
MAVAAKPCSLASMTSRPTWAWLFPLVIVVAVAIAIAADFRMFDARVFAGIDKQLHFALYGACGFAAVGWFHWVRARRVIAIVAAVVLAEELTQGLFSHRSVDGWDIVASCGGVVLCGAAAAWLRRSPRPAHAS